MSKALSEIYRKMCLPQWNLLAWSKGISIKLWRACGADGIQNKGDRSYMWQIYSITVFSCGTGGNRKQSQCPNQSWASRFLNIYVLLASYSLGPRYWTYIILRIFQTHCGKSKSATCERVWFSCTSQHENYGSLLLNFNKTIYMGVVFSDTREASDATWHSGVL